MIHFSDWSGKICILAAILYEAFRLGNITGWQADPGPKNFCNRRTKIQQSTVRKHNSIGGEKFEISSFGFGFAQRPDRGRPKVRTNFILVRERF